MDDLVAFLRGRLEEDEELARRVTPGPWVADGQQVRTAYVSDMPGWKEDGVREPVANLLMTQGSAQAEERNARHIARWNPARVLADVQAKRRLLETYEKARDVEVSLTERFRAARGIPVSHAVDTGMEFGLRAAIRHLALPYRDHPDFQQHWLPDDAANGAGVTG